MNFRFSGWFQTFKLSERSRLAQGFVAMALLLVVFTVITAYLVVQQLNDRDLKRLEQVGELEIKQAALQLEMLSSRYSVMLSNLAQDQELLALASKPDPTLRTTALKRLLTVAPLVNHLLLLDSQGHTVTSLRRVDGQITDALSERGYSAALSDTLHEFLTIKPKELWYSDLIALNSSDKTNKHLIYGGVQLIGEKGNALGFLLLGVDVLRFSKGLTIKPDKPELPSIVLLDAQGTILTGDEATQAQVHKLKLSQTKVWTAMQDFESAITHSAQTADFGGAGLAWRHVAWGGERAGDFAVVRNTRLNLVSWVDPTELNRALQGNAQLVSGIWASGLLLLLIATGLLYRRSRTIEVYREREATMRRLVGLGYWRLNYSTLHMELGAVLLKSLSLQGQPHDLWPAWLACLDSDADRQSLQAAIAQTCRTGVSFELELLMHNRTSGAKAWGLVTGRASPGGHQRWVEGSVQNITQRKQAEIEAATFRSAVQNIVDWAKLGVWEYDLTNNERRINRYLSEMLGLDLPLTQDYVPHDWTQKVHPDDLQAMRQARFDYLAGKTQMYQAECRIQHTQGHWVYLVIEGQNMEFNANGQPTLMRGTAIDVTKLYLARTEAVQANQAKTQFLSRMSHELRTPLNAIMGYTQLLRLSPNLDAQEQDHVNAVLAGSRHLLNLINDLLQITRDDPQALPLKPQPLNLSELCLRCISLMQPLMAEKQLLLQNRISAEHWVMADSLRAQQCIINILANAIKYSEEHTSITLDVSQTAGGLVRLAVRDQGPGIAPEVGNQVFEPFYRSSEAISHVEGAGIGLTVSLRLAQQMGGHISYESAVGIGSVFYLDLPKAAASSEPPYLGRSRSGVTETAV